MIDSFPTHGFIMWPVGNGDSSTIVVDDNTVLQIDLNHTSKSEDNNDPKTPVIDVLESLLPQRDDRPYLAVFALTHPDQDHCRGFAELLERVDIGELWFTPRIFREYKKDLSEHAQSFREEAERRVIETIKNPHDVQSGDRVRIIGYDEILEEDEYDGFPSELLTVPGNTITELDGQSYKGLFRAFIHAPFKDDADSDRNDTSLAMKVTLYAGDTIGSVLFFGDLKYPTLKRIFDISEGSDLLFDAMLSPHHCSKSALYWEDEDDNDEVLKVDLLDKIANHAKDNSYIVASSQSFPTKNEPGDDPPHLIARDRYQEIASVFLCTAEHGEEAQPDPIYFSVTEAGFEYVGEISPFTENTELAEFAEVIKEARGQNQPPKDPVGFGFDA